MFYYRIWCDTCYNDNDPHGCFDGTKENDDTLYATAKEAYFAAWYAERICSLYDTEVVYEPTHEVIEAEDAWYTEYCKEKRA